MERRNYQNLEFLEKIIFGNCQNAHCNLTMLQTPILDTRNAEPNFMFTEPKNSFFFKLHAMQRNI